MPLTRSQLLINFPRLRESEFAITSVATQRYNCVALAVGVNTFFWGPGKPRKLSKYGRNYYWPPNLPEENHISSIIALFRTLGYETCPSSQQEKGMEKIAIYEGRKGWSHVARQRPDGMWWSKLTELDDIVHKTAQDLDDGMYGNAVHFMKRIIDPYADERIRGLLEEDYYLPASFSRDDLGLIDLTCLEPIGIGI